MELTFEEVCERLKQLDEYELVELFNISSEDLVERFRDLIEDDQDKYMEFLNQYFEDSDYEDS